MKTEDEASKRACEILRKNHLTESEIKVGAFDDKFIVERYPDEWSCFMQAWKETNEYAKEEAIRFSEHLLHGDWRLNPHSEKTLWRTVSQVEQLGSSKPIHEGITTEQVYELFKK